MRDISILKIHLNFSESKKLELKCYVSIERCQIDQIDCIPKSGMSGRTTTKNQNSFEFLKSSNDSSKLNLGKKPVLGIKSNGGDSDDDISPSDNSDIEMDIGALQPAFGSASDSKIDESLNISETKDSKTKDSDSLFKTPVRVRQSKPKKCLGKICFPATNVATSFSMSPLSSKFKQMAMHAPVIKKMC